jgi:hypothetical protein
MSAGESSGAPGSGGGDKDTGGAFRVKIVATVFFYG